MKTPWGNPNTWCVTSHYSVRGLDLFSMSFNHSGTPQSLQADYAIVSHFTASARETEDQQPIGLVLGSPRGIPIRGTVLAGVTVISERTPLLKPPSPVPRLHESLDDNICYATLADQTPTCKIFHEEFSILTLSALPVFGCVLFLNIPVIFTPISSQYPTFRILFYSCFSHLHRSHFYTGSGGLHFRFNDGFRHRI